MATQETKLTETVNIPVVQVVYEKEVLDKTFRIYGVNPASAYENPLFLATEVAEWIEHTNLRTLLKNIDESEKTQCMIIPRNDCLQGQNNTPLVDRGIQANTPYNFLTEDGLYEVLMQSRKPLAKSFKKQVKAILKEIRKTGAYSVKLLSPLEILKQQIQIMEDHERQLQEHEQQISKNIQDIKDTKRYQSIAVFRQEKINKDTRQRLEQHDTDIQSLKHKFEDPGPREELKTFVTQVYNLFKDTKEATDYGHMYSTIYSNLETVTHISLTKRLSNLKKRLEEQGATKTQINKANVIDVIEQDPNLWQPLRDILNNYRQQIFGAA